MLLVIKSENVATGYKIGDIDLAFPGGAISVIAAPTSHGKTYGLINFTLGALENDHNLNAYFFTYEESWESIVSKFINTWIAEELSKNNKKAIDNYFRTQNTQSIQPDKISLFIKRKEDFFNNLINSGRLKIFYSGMPTEDLVDAIDFIKHHTTVGLVCIDYMQLLKSNKKAQSRQEELKQICLLLKDCAIQTGLPFVLTAQFNREVISKNDLRALKIAEAGDIERVASVIVGMWNHNFDEEKQSKIYFEILKGRKIGSGYNAVMYFDGNTGKINQRIKESKLLVNFG